MHTIHTRHAHRFCCLQRRHLVTKPLPTTTTATDLLHHHNGNLPPPPLRRRRRRRRRRTTSINNGGNIVHSYSILRHCSATQTNQQPTTARAHSLTAVQFLYTPHKPTDLPNNTHIYQPIQRQCTEHVHQPYINCLQCASGRDSGGMTGGRTDGRSLTHSLSRRKPILCTVYFHLIIY